MSLADRLSKAQRPDKTAEVRNRVQQRLVEVLGPRLYDSSISETELSDLVHKRLRELLDAEETPLSAQERAAIIKDIGDGILGLGPLEKFMRDPEVTEVMVNNSETIFVERRGRLYPTDARFYDEEQLRRTIEKIVAKVGRRIDEASPYVDARLPDGSRVNAIIPPLALDGPALTIRKFSRDPLQLHHLIEKRSLTPEIGDLLKAIVQARLNVLISGGTGTGKTTFLNILSGFIPDDERIVTIEDAAELQLRQEHVVRLETRPANIEGK